MANIIIIFLLNNKNIYIINCIMPMPVRCFTCGKIIINNEELEKYKKLHNFEEIFKLLNIKRYCCKRIFNLF